MTSRIFSASIFIVMIEGAHSDIFSREVEMTLFISSRMNRRPAFACSSATFMISGVTPSTLMSICSAVTPSLRAGDLEVHVAEVVFVTEDVGEHREAAAFEHEAHGDARDRRLDRHAGVHQRQAGAADAGHRARAVRLENFRDDADDVRELRHVRHHGVDAAAGQVAVADFAALRRAHHAGLTDRERREVVVEHERLAAFAFERVDDLRVATGAERRDHEGLRLATREQRRTVRTRQHADLHGDRTNGLVIAAVDARLAVQHALTDDVALELEERVVDLRPCVNFGASPPASVANSCGLISLSFATRSFLTVIE